MSKVVLEAISLDRSMALRAAVLPAVIVLTVVSLGIMSAGNRPLLVVGGAVVAFVMAAWIIPITSQHKEYLVFVIGLLYLAISLSVFSEELRALFHYSILIALCVPLVPGLYKSRLVLRGNFKLYCVYFVWGAVTILYSLAPEYSAVRLGGAVLGFLAIAAAVTDVHGEADIDRLLKAFLLACGVMTLATVASAFVLPGSIAWQTPADGLDPATLIGMQQHGAVPTGLDRFRGFFNNANDVGSLMLVTVSTAMVCWQKVTRRQRVIVGLVIAAAIMLAALADSRSAFVALAVGMALYLLWRYRVRGAVGIGCALTIGVAALAVYGSDLGSYVMRGNVDTLTGRTDIWAYAIQEIVQRPLRGYGYEVGGAIFDSRYFPLWYGPWNEGPHSSLHNGYLAHLVGVGIPGTLLWFAAVITPWSFVLRRTEDAWGLKVIAFLIVIPLLVYNLTEAALSDFMGPEGILLGLVWAIAERHKMLETVRIEHEKAEVLQTLAGPMRALLGH